MRSKLIISLNLILLSSSAFAIETKAEYAVLVDAETNSILFEKNPNVATAPSSMSKLMTTYILLEKLKDGSIKLDDKYNVSEKAWKQEGSRMFLNLGEFAKVEDLLRGIIVQSGNDACVTVAEGIAGSEEAFAEMMQEKAKTLGLTDSSFKNSTGLPVEGHVMSSMDLAKLGQRIVQDFPEFYNYFSETEFTYNNIKQGNRNELLYKFPEVDGMKTGHADKAGYGIVASAHKNDRRVIAVVNGLKSGKERSEEAGQLLRYGLSNFDNVAVAKGGQEYTKLAVASGKKAEVSVATEKDVIYTLPKVSSKNIEVTVNYLKPLIAPIKEGDKVGELEIKLPNQEAQKVSLIATETVKKLSFFGRVSKNLKGLVGA